LKGEKKVKSNKKIGTDSWNQLQKITIVEQNLKFVFITLQKRSDIEAFKSKYGKLFKKKKLE
jgi:hypothetical protein